ncbi:MAG: glycosyltransferase family 4 protein [Planctomycetes bacterium]|nr:glycosyltransferase family 4 protein [Planctomycetota bacterium]
MTRHFAIAAWALGTGPSGAHRRFETLLRAVARQLEPDERITVLHGSYPNPLELGPAVTWRQFGIPAAPTWQRIRAERQRCAQIVRSIGASVLDLGTLPVPPALPCPVVLTIHDLRDLDGWRRRMPRGVARAIVRHAVARAAAVIVPSEFTASRMREHGCDLAPIHVIPGSIEENTLRHGSPTEPNYVLHVGHVERRKNLEILLEAIASTRTTPMLRFVGRDHGARRALDEKARALGVEDRVQWLGTVSEAELMTIYDGAAAIVVPSHYEGFGFPALEGLAADRPVIVSDCGALPEVVGNAGTIVPADDATAWARAIDTAIAAPTSNPDRHRRVLEFDPDRAAEATLAVWRMSTRSDRVR